MLYAIADYIGHDRFKAVVKRYLEKTRFQEPPYTNSLEFLAELPTAGRLSSENAEIQPCERVESTRVEAVGTLGDDAVVAKEACAVTPTEGIGAA